MRQRIPIVLSSAALAVAVLATTPLGHAVLLRVARTRRERHKPPVLGEGGVHLADIRVVQAGAHHGGFQIVVLLCPTGLCGREPNPELASSALG